MGSKRISAGLRRVGLYRGAIEARQPGYESGAMRRVASGLGGNRREFWDAIPAGKSRGGV